MSSPPLTSPSERHYSLDSRDVGPLERTHPEVADRLARAIATEADARDAIRVLDQLGRTRIADALRLQLSAHDDALQAYAVAVAEALPDDPRDAITVLIGTLAMATRAICEDEDPRLHTTVCAGVLEALNSTLAEMRHGLDAGAPR